MVNKNNKTDEALEVKINSFRMKQSDYFRKMVKYAPGAVFALLSYPATTFGVYGMAKGEASGPILFLLGVSGIICLNPISIPSCIDKFQDALYMYKECGKEIERIKNS